MFPGYAPILTGAPRHFAVNVSCIVSIRVPEIVSKQEQILRIPENIGKHKIVFKLIQNAESCWEFWKYWFWYMHSLNTLRWEQLVKFWLAPAPMADLYYPRGLWQQQTSRYMTRWARIDGKWTYYIIQYNEMKLVLMFRIWIPSHTMVPPSILIPIASEPIPRVLHLGFVDQPSERPLVRGDSGAGFNPVHILDNASEKHGRTNRIGVGDGQSRDDKWNLEEDEALVAAAKDVLTPMLQWGSPAQKASAQAPMPGAANGGVE
ncbi:hypothetical protein DFH07DRAFT_784536 [Mycena maculata]|uniref:Uncharacterized protein n=1 Tax=Mycena maculata TaxID=230809 RepID=A0AAD7HGC9_9AGAR|nr:hypothetical protein DFH07DRAFT_784536 [Mycena maculata]